MNIEMLQGERIYLRLLEESDLILRPKWFNDPEIITNLMMNPPISLSKTKQWFVESLSDPSRQNFSICMRDTNQVIGMSGFLQIDLVHRRAQFYVTIGEKEFWGQRLADEVITLALEYGFKIINLNKIFLYTLTKNDKARKVYERNGFRLEGILRQQCYFHGVYQDLHQHGILKQEWEKR